MKLFPVSFCFNSAMLLIGDISTMPLHTQLVMVDLGSGGIWEMLVDLCDLTLVR